MDPRTEAALAGHAVVFLDVAIADARQADRLRPQPAAAAVNPRAAWVRMMNERRPTYERVATVRVDTAGRTPDEVAADDRRRARGGPARERPATRTTDRRRRRDYDVVIGTGVLGELPGLLGDDVERVLVVHPPSAARHRRGVRDALAGAGV